MSHLSHLRHLTSEFLLLISFLEMQPVVFLKFGEGMQRRASVSNHSSQLAEANCIRDAGFAFLYEHQLMGLW